MTLKQLIFLSISLTLYSCSAPTSTISDSSSNLKADTHEIIFPPHAINKNPNTPISEIDTLLCSIDEYNFLITPTGLLKWGNNLVDSFQLKTEVWVVKAYLHLENNILFIFYEETDEESGTSRVEKISLDKKENVWVNNIWGFNLGQPYIKDNFVYVTSFGTVGKINLADGQYAFQFKELYDHKKNSFNSFDTVIFKDSLTLFISNNFYSKMTDSIIVNEKTSEMITKK